MRDQALIGRTEPSRRVILASAGLLLITGLASCGRKDEKAADPDAPSGPAEGSLEWAIQGPWRAADRPRDIYRHPLETLRFFGLQPAMHVVEFWPGSGWYSEILAPYLNKGDGAYYGAGFVTGEGANAAQAALVANFERRFGSDRKLYGDVKFSAFGPTTGPVAPAGTADMVLFLRNIHAWMAAGIAEKAFADAYTALKPGGILGIEQHRLAPDQDQDPAAANGYVQEAFVKQLAAEAGFIFVAASEINANPEDTKDYPFGVETLPPRLLTAPQGSPPDPAFDSAKYRAIGESDRMTLKFRKPE